MADFGEFVGGAIKMLGGAALTAGALQGSALLWAWSFGPNGFTQAKPVCEAERVCVVVAGLKDDVSLGFGAAGEIMGFDMADDTAQRVASDISVVDLAQRDIQVLRYPAEISLPKAGSGNHARRTARALERARVIGEATGANLVVIGRVVSDDFVRLSFVDPRRTADTPAPLDYELGDADARQSLLQYMSAALNAVHDDRPLPPAPRDMLPPAPHSLPDLGSEKPDDTAVNFTPPPEPFPTTTVAPPIPIAIERARVRTLPEPAIMNQLYPRRARDRNERGQASVACLVALDGTLHHCSVINETPERRGFGEAAIRLAEEHTVGFPELHDGEPAPDGEVRVAYTFVLN